MTMKDKSQVPVTVLTGFLGSGKTTLLNHLLNDRTHGTKFAVIENEFGEVGIDENILSENANEEIIEVMNGCICCTVRGDLVVALKNLYKKVESFDGIIIETTGLADPAPVVQTFFVDEDIQANYKLDSVITVVDAKHIIPRLEEKKPEGVENEAVEQVAFADKVILNKTDLVTDPKGLEAIEKRIKVINPACPIIRATYSNVSPKDLLNIEAFDLNRILDFDPEFLDEEQEHEHDSSVTSVGCKVETEVNVQLLESWIQRLITEEGANLYRYKGVIAVMGSDEKFVFQGVGMMFSGGFQGVWKQREKRVSRFIFIGKNLDTDFLKEGFLACTASTKLRFAVGDKVEANVGGYTKGTIISLWDEGNAYRIRLDDEEKTEVWAPIDIDNYVRVA